MINVITDVGEFYANLGESDVDTPTVLYCADSFRFSDKIELATNFFSFFLNLNAPIRHPTESSRAYSGF